jgi:hypothetical protein
VLERSYNRPTEADADTDRGVVVFVRNDQAPLPNQGGDRSRVGRKSHGHDDRVLLAYEPRNERLSLRVQIQRATLQP